MIAKICVLMALSMSVRLYGLSVDIPEIDRINVGEAESYGVMLDLQFPTDEMGQRVRENGLRIITIGLTGQRMGHPIRRLSVRLINKNGENVGSFPLNIEAVNQTYTSYFSFNRNMNLAIVISVEYSAKRMGGNLIIIDMANNDIRAMEEKHAQQADAPEPLTRPGDP